MTADQTTGHPDPWLRRKCSINLDHKLTTKGLSKVLGSLKAELQADTSPSLSRGGKWKKRDCPRETLLIGLSRLSLLYSFT